LGQDTSVVRVLSYNLLNYSGDDAKATYYQTVINAIDPDVIVAQEVNGTTGYNQFLSEVLNTDWSGAPFTNQSANQDIALYYKNDHFTFVSTALATTALSSGLRAVVEFSMEHNESGNKINFYGLHFKASSGSTEAATRKTEATNLRNHLNGLDSNSYFLVCGDFNIYGSGVVYPGQSYSFNEEVYSILTDSGGDSDGQVVDPLNAPGIWHNSGSFSWLHTQSTRKEQFGGGATGALDDRFDLIFISKAFYDSTSNLTYVDDSYTSFGNDGAHFNQSINAGSNSAVSSTIAEALYQASDHLPVYTDIQIITPFVSIDNISLMTPEVFSLGQPYPNPFNPSITIPYSVHKTGDIKLSIYNILGEEMVEIANGFQIKGTYKAVWNAAEFPSGIYIVKLSQGGNFQERKISFIK